VIVSAGATCTLDGARVDGNVEVREGGSLIARDADVDGDIQGDGHLDVSVTGGHVDGNVQLEDGATAVVRGVVIDGDLQSEDNRGAQDFSDNVIDGNLQCEGNTPAPVGGNNQVRGNREGQCSSL
jgi:hypothetical protein